MPATHHAHGQLLTDEPRIDAWALRAVDRPFTQASTLPGRLFSDPGIYEREHRRLFRRAWHCIGRAEEVPEGSDRVVEVARSAVTLVRHPDGTFRAHSATGRSVRVEEWRGFLFVNLNPRARRLAEYLGSFVARAAPYPLEQLRLAHRVVYDIAANWKLVEQNANECYHCPGVHPQLVRLTPYRSGEEDLKDGPVFGGWMEFVPGVETLTPKGKTGRVIFPSLSEEDRRRVYYYVLYPGNFLSLLPDYVTLDWFIPQGPERTRLVFNLYVDRDEPDSADDAMAFWDTTNRQDWRICELAHLGSKARAYRQGRYSGEEELVHALDRYYVRRMGFSRPAR